ncbi:MAG: biopolymer transporter ExbD [Ignavibacteriae bacterium]|nr:biopolymer transporter ExbD [Ignavibacteriota bacterium]
MRIRLPQTHTTLSAFSYSSLTDIVLLLLIFFLLTSSFIATKSLTVKLPDARNAQATEQGTVTVTLEKSGRILINDTETTAEAFAGQLRALLTEPAKQTIVLAADKEVPFQNAVRIMDEARGLGVARFFISTREAATAP